MFELYKNAAATVPSASTNRVRLYVDTDGLPYVKDNTGAITPLKGDTGATGATGAGVPVGGTTNQVLAKASATNYDTAWVTPIQSVTGTSPVVSSGGTTPAISLASGYGDTQNPYASNTANYVLATPNGTAGVPTFRAIVAADIPTLNQNTTGTAANVTDSSNSTLVTLSALSLPYSQLSGTVPTWNQNTTGTAANITASSNATLTTLSSLSLPGSQVSGDISGNAANVTASNNSTLTTLSSLSLPGSQVTGNIGGNAANVTGTVAIANGGTGQTTAAAAITALSGTQTSGRYLRSDGTNTALAAIVAGDVPTLNQNTTGTAANVTASSNSTLTTLSALSLPGSQVSGNISGNAANVTGIVAVANGGSGTATPSLVAGTNVTVTGTWPNQTIAASGGGGGSTLVISNKTAAYTVVAGDLATVINCSGATSFTVSLTAAATLGAGFNVTVWNNTTTAAMAVTIDPNGAETIDGVATLILRRGEGMQIVCDGTNWQTGNKKVMRGYAENVGNGDSRPLASGTNAIAVGPYSEATSTSAMAFGTTAVASAVSALALGRNCTASSSSSTAIGMNSGASGSQAVTGLGAMALGGSYASGADSFAAATTDNTSTYGAKNTWAIAISYLAVASGTPSIAIGAQASASNTNCLALGRNAIASGSGSTALTYGEALQNGKYAYQGSFNGNKRTQYGLLVPTIDTTDATPSVLTVGSTAASTTNQIILPNSSAYSFTGTVVARQQAAGGTASAAWKVEGLIRREANAGTTTLVASTVTAISNVPGWTLALSADTTNGGLAVTATGAAATNIRWVATIQTSECTYA